MTFVEKLIPLLVEAIVVFGLAEEHNTHLSPQDAANNATFAIAKSFGNHIMDNPVNIVMAPIGLLFLLAMYASGTTGPLRNDILKFLHIADYDKMLKSYSGFNNLIQMVEDNTIITANKVFLAKGMSVTDNFNDVTKRFNAGYSTLDFKNKKKAVAAINNWGSKMTKGLVSEAVTENDISSATVVALMNVIYFKGQWKKPFNPKKTKLMDFTNLNGQKVKKPMMNLEGYFNYTEIEGVPFLDIPFTDGNAKLVVGLVTNVTAYAKGEHFRLLHKKKYVTPRYKNIDLQLPKFEVETRLEFKDSFTKLGLGKLFSTPASGVVEGERVSVSSVFSKAVFKVDEEGATGAAVGGMLILYSYDINQLRFYANAPFLYALYYKDLIIFEGFYCK